MLGVWGLGFICISVVSRLLWIGEGLCGMCHCDYFSLIFDWYVIGLV